MLHGTLQDRRIVWAIGIFQDTDGFSGALEGKDFALSGRVAGPAWYEAGGRRVLHLGVSGRYERPREGLVRYSSRPEAHLAPKLVDTGTLAGHEVVTLELESAFVIGPLSLQAPFSAVRIGQPGVPTRTLTGFHVQASFFLTGEYRSYRLSKGAFGSTKPRRDVLNARPGLGAWEVAGRYSSVNLESGSVTGGKLDDVTVGLNWYLGPGIRLMVNYIHAFLEDGGKADVVGARCQIAM
jgi:phosphate-selective porin OprO/OprP